MNHQTRAALVAMGQDMARAREVLAVTERRSLHTVYDLEFRRLTNVCKSPKEPIPPKIKKPEDAIAQSNRVAEIAYVLADRLGRTKARVAGCLGCSSVICSSAMFQRTSFEHYLLLAQPLVWSHRNAATADEFDFPRRPSSGTVPR